MKCVEGQLYCQLQAATADAAEIVVIIPTQCGYSLRQLCETVRDSAAVRLFEWQDGERIYYDEQ